MKKWLVLILLVAALSGCSWQKVKKWIYDTDWERPDQTIKVIEFFIR